MGTLLVTGSRNWGYTKRIDPLHGGRVLDLEELRILKHAIRRLHVRWGGRARLIHGAALGADRFACAQAERLGWVIEEHYPESYRRPGMSYGAACYARNAGMVESLAHYAMDSEIAAAAFWKARSRGTGHTIDLLRARGIEPEIFQR